jgi:hypothetical protein
MAKLTYTVEVDSDDEVAVDYLNVLRDTFRMISERLAGFGFTQDEYICTSDISHSS